MEAITTSRHETAGWALLFGALATVGQGVLAGGLLALDLLVYGLGSVVSPETVAAPDEGRYVLAVVLAVLLTLAGGPALAWFGFGASSRSWPAAVQGLVAAVVAALLATCALLLALGINPIAFVSAL